MGTQITMPAGVRQAAMLGLGVHRPERVVSNDEICELIDSNDEWIRTRTGIRNRRFAEPKESVIDMSVPAAQKALEAAGVEPEQIGAVIVATSTYVMQTPPAAAVVADRLGTKGPAAFDLGGGCAGFCTALALASDMVRGGSSDKVLVIGVEQMSVTTDPYDRSTRFIFGDGAGAVVVGATDAAGIGPVSWGSDGSQADAIVQEPGWLDFIDNPTGPRPFIKMAGTAVFRWAAFEMGKVALDAVEKAGLSVDDLDAFVPHQANARITEVIARSMKLPETVPVADDIEETGNTSAASVPLAMEAMLRKGEAKAGDTALLLAFGAGLSYAAQVVTLPPLQS
ncbi:beta-ketoacyl-ACP synthase III [Rhodococcus sp. HNM0569]|uniref:beta-ketoacyl-ACP synthase III n=1 Tax=Rhodococcus sp. HNM0569 TaxID=2716340 RepID=UPI00146BF4E6|nr:beta-ketoacyl-ACP synthase III [Rhodococcus sp. HNM0569]NLU83682.1 ketoacyl-ACP synthase III [Rhodococcus sp. HNM0569]